MRALLAVSMVLVLSLCGSIARADSITRLAFALESDDVVLRVDSDAALGSPRMHLDAGAVRLWFPGVAQGHFIERRGDGRALRRVTARPGAADTALVVLDLGDARRLAPEDVRVALDGTHAIVRIARAVLPAAAPVATPRATTAATAPAAATATAPAAATATAPAAAPASATAPAAAPASATATAPPTATATALAPAAPTTRAATRAETLLPPAAMGGFAGAIPDSKSAGMRTVALLVVLLGGLALFGRWLKQKRACRPAAAIRVIASHRLGAKHQLVVVRAFDQEILLSVNGGETRRIASRRAGEDSEMVPMNEPSVTPEPRTAAGRLLALVPAAIPAMEGGASRREPRSPSAAVTSPFGAELARLVRGIAPASPAARPAVSDSVSGLVRLRESKAQR